jgi:hypothetical protein
MRQHIRDIIYYLCLIPFIVLAAYATGIILANYDSRDIGAQTTYSLFLPIYCSGPDYYHQPEGTGFPIAEHLIMTAGHIHCPKIMELSYDNGQSWTNIPTENQFKHLLSDEKIIYVPNHSFTHWAKFRDANVGEKSYMFGISMGFILSSGTVMQRQTDELLLGNLPIGGLSGSAIVASDGRVIGMGIAGKPTHLGDGYPSGTVTIGISAEKLQKTIQNYTENAVPWLIQDSSRIFLQIGEFYTDLGDAPDAKPETESK